MSDDDDARGVACHTTPTSAFKRDESPRTESPARAAAAAASAKNQSLLLGDEVVSIMGYHRLWTEFSKDNKDERLVIDAIQQAVNEVSTRLILDVCAQKKRTLGSKTRLTISSEDVIEAIPGLAEDLECPARAFYKYAATLQDQLGSVNPPPSSTTSTPPRGQGPSKAGRNVTEYKRRKVMDDAIFDLEDSPAMRDPNVCAVRQAFLKPECRVRDTFLSSLTFGIADYQKMYPSH
jgi:hypothetical protein